MTLTLYCSLTSPYARRVRLAVLQLGLAEQVHEEVVDPFASPDVLLANNPLSKIPVLRDEGADIVLPDSRLILDYLLQRAGRRLPEADGDWQGARRLAIAEGLIDAAVAIVLENRRPESIRYPAQIDRQQAAITRCLAALAEAPPSETAFANADPLALTLATALGYLDFRLPWLGWRQNTPALAAWVDALAGDPAMRATRPPESPGP